MIRPYLNLFIDVSAGFKINTRMKAYTKLTVVMWCQIFYMKYLASSSGDFRRDRRRGRPVDKIRNFEKTKF